MGGRGSVGPSAPDLRATVTHHGMLLLLLMLVQRSRLLELSLVPVVRRRAVRAAHGAVVRT